jgi:hypothetical protein
MNVKEISKMLALLLLIASHPALKLWYVCVFQHCILDLDHLFLLVCAFDTRMEGVLPAS